MAKKVRRARRLSAAQTYEPSAAPAAAEAAPTPTVTASREVNFSEEYYYILSDLRRIGLLAAITLSGLVILSFFIK